MCLSMEMKTCGFLLFALIAGASAAQVKDVSPGAFENANPETLDRITAHLDANVHELDELLQDAQQAKLVQPAQFSGVQVGGKASLLLSQSRQGAGLTKGTAPLRPVVLQSMGASGRMMGQGRWPRAPGPADDRLVLVQPSSEFVRQIDGQAPAPSMAEAQPVGQVVYDPAAPAPSAAEAVAAVQAAVPAADVPVEDVGKCGADDQPPCNKIVKLITLKYKLKMWQGILACVGCLVVLILIIVGLVCLCSGGGGADAVPRSCCSCSWFTNCFYREFKQDTEQDPDELHEVWHREEPSRGGQSKSPSR